MKKLALIAALLCGCAHTTTQTTKPYNKTAEAAPTTSLTAITGSSYTFNEPAGVNVVKMLSDERKGDMLIDDPNNIFVLVKVGIVQEPFEVFATVIASALANSGFVFSLVQPIVWLNNQGASFTASRNTLTVFTHLGLVDGVGVAFTCGGLTNDKTRNDVWCQ